MKVLFYLISIILLLNKHNNSKVPTNKKFENKNPTKNITQIIPFHNKNATNKLRNLISEVFVKIKDYDIKIKSNGGNLNLLVVSSFKRLQISLGYIKEIDISGNEVGLGQKENHQIKNVSKVNFIASSSNAKFEKLNTTKIDISSNKDNTLIKPDTECKLIYNYFLEDGSISMNDNKLKPVDSNDNIINFIIKNWPFCKKELNNCFNEATKTYENAEYLEVKWILDNYDKTVWHTFNKTENSLEFNFLKLTMPIFYKNNQQIYQMPDGYPKYNIFNANQMEVILRFKVFEGEINYDTLMNMYPANDNLNFSMGVVAIIFLILTMVAIVKCKKSKIKSPSLDKDPDGDSKIPL